MTFEKIAAILADSLETDVSTIKMETTWEQLGLDSLDTVELIMKLEEEFDVTIEMNEKLKTVADVVNLIDELKNNG